MIKLALADDEALFRKGMTALLEDFADFKVILSAQDGQDLLDQLATIDTLPDVLLLDLKMPNLNGIEAAKILRVEYPDLKIIIISTYFSNAYVTNMIELGAASYLPKNTEPEIVASTIHEVVKQGFSYSQEVMEVIRQNMLQKTKSKLKVPFGISLTKRESEILQLICEEHTAAEIGEKLFLSKRTVEGHRNNLLQKLNCRNVAGLVVFAIQHQLVNINPDTFRFGK